MRNGLKADATLAALILSAAAHVALMFWVRPKVMTHVVSDAVRASRRVPMAMRRPDAVPEPVKFDVAKDLPAQRDAPDADDVVLAVPAPELEAPAPEVAMPMPSAIEAPNVLERLRPDVEAPILPVAAVERTAKDDALAAMPFELSLPATDLAPTVGDAVAAPVAVQVAAPAFAPPSVEPDAAPLAEPPEKIVQHDATEKDDFKPMDAVMPQVDEAVVRQEKEAVRDLINDNGAADLSAMVNVSHSAFLGADGYCYFKVSITPRQGLSAVPKDVVVLIDASGSIGSDRLDSCRKAARSILRTCTNTGDRFNLVAFRDRFSYAFNSWRSCDAVSFMAADQWLKRLAAHGRTDVFSTIASVLTLPRDPARPIIALVVTDGDANAGVRDTAEIISKFSVLNDGLISVYMYGVKSSANRELIDVLTRGNRGESFVHDGWRWNAGDGIEALSERFRDPILTDLRVVFPASSGVEAYPTLLKNIYRGNSVEIVGRLRSRPNAISFSLRGLAGANAYESFFRLPLDSAREDDALPSCWQREQRIDQMLR